MTDALKRRCVWRPAKICIELGAAGLGRVCRHPTRTCPSSSRRQTQCGSIGEVGKPCCELARTRQLYHAFFRLIVRRLSLDRIEMRPSGPAAFVMLSKISNTLRLPPSTHADTGQVVS